MGVSALASSLASAFRRSFREPSFTQFIVRDSFCLDLPLSFSLSLTLQHRAIVRQAAAHEQPGGEPREAGRR
eukprot:176366-Alexandrium_andersonii.AAC.1